VTLDVPEAVRKKFTADGEEHWLDALPTIVHGLAADWSLTIGSAMSGGTAAFVTTARCHDGTDAVLKIAPPSHRRQIHAEATVLALADGGGCARLLRHDDDRVAMLLERLGPAMSELDLPREQQHDLLCDAARQLWRPVDPSLGLPTGADKARWLLQIIPELWDATDRPCSERAVADALACAERRLAAHDDERAVLTHGDVHELNALQAADGTFKLIDPDGVRAEPEYDLGVIVRTGPGEDDLRVRTDRLAARTGGNRDAIWEWGAGHRVASGLYCATIDYQPFGRRLLADADRYALG
jgi:streptomycin 6-kinase